jgi:hypothetical protein
MFAVLTLTTIKRVHTLDIMLKPSEGLKDIWKRECKSHCSVYWIAVKAMPFTRYESCVAQCYKRKWREELLPITVPINVANGPIKGIAA